MIEKVVDLMSKKVICDGLPKVDNVIKEVDNKLNVHCPIYEKLVKENRRLKSKLTQALYENDSLRARR